MASLRCPGGRTLVEHRRCSINPLLSLLLGLSAARVCFHDVFVEAAPIGPLVIWTWGSIGPAYLTRGHWGHMHTQRNLNGPLWTWPAMEVDLKSPQIVALSLFAFVLRPFEGLWASSDMPTEAGKLKPFFGRASALERRAFRAHSGCPGESGLC